MHLSYSLLTASGDTKMQMYITDADKNTALFAEVESVEQGRYYWTQIAHLRGCELTGFEIREADYAFYIGNYITDEC
jgi:hypothetical protein